MRAIFTSLIFPLVAIVNTFAVLTLFTLKIDVSYLSLITANVILSIFLLISFKPYLKPNNKIAFEDVHTKRNTTLLVLCMCIVVATLVYAVSHTLLPTFHYDSLTNWNMRSKISFIEHALTFESHGEVIAKPHYPFLYHSLQVSAASLFGWSERVINGVHLMLTVSAMSAVFLILKKLKGMQTSLISISIIIGLPLMTLHAGGSYADITLVSFAMLSLATFAVFKQSSETLWLVLSGLFVAGCVWTKAEGLFFCLLPWCALVTRYMWKHPDSVRSMVYPSCIGMLLSLLWPVLALLNGYALTPHGQSDRALTLNLEAVEAISKALFVHGSFGVFWYGMMIVLVMIIVSVRRERIPLDRQYQSTLLWGLLAVLGYIGVYLFTSNAEYLILGQSFDRQMLLPAALLTISCALILPNPKT